MKIIFILILLYFMNCKDHSVLLDAIRSGDTIKTKELLENSYSANALDNSKSALVLAIEANSIDIVKILVEKGADVNFHPGESPREKFQNPTPLQKAAQLGNKEIVVFLLNSGARLEKDSGLSGNFIYPSALHYAAQSGNIEIAELLLEKGIDINYGLQFKPIQTTPLEWAISAGKREMVKFLFSKNAKWEKNNLLQIALSGTSPEILSYLETEKSIPIFTDENFCKAVQMDNVNFVQNFSKKSLNTKNLFCLNGTKKIFPLELAVRNQSKEMIKLLIDLKFNLNEINEDGLGLLHINCFYKNGKEIENLLIKNNINKNIKSTKEYNIQSIRNSTESDVHIRSGLEYKDFCTFLPDRFKNY